MGCWTAEGNGICQSCGRTEAGHSVRKIAIEFLRVMRWHYGTGETIGGQQYEVLLCPDCSNDQHRRPRQTVTLEQDALPIDWEQFKVLPKTQGGHTR